MTSKQPAKKPTPFPTSERHGQHPVKPQGESKPLPDKPGEADLDEGIEESFPASDPVSVNVTKVVKNPKDGSAGEGERTDVGADRDKR